MGKKVKELAMDHRTRIIQELSSLKKLYIVNHHI